MGPANALVPSRVKNEAQTSIVAHLMQVAEERQRRSSLPHLQAAVQAVKRYQQRRFMLTYSDLLSTQRYGPAAQFFLEELYGPDDFTRRDAQFMRIAPALVRLFPAELVHTVKLLAHLHEISESLDSQMASYLSQPSLDARAYIHAWQSTGQPDQREYQIALILEIGAALDRYAHKPFLRQTLRLMRGPARRAGLGELQRFLETGFDAFKAMNGADEFLLLIGDRERTLAAALFGATQTQEFGATPAPDSALEVAFAYLP